LSGVPGPGDIVINAGGTIVFGTDAQFSSNTSSSATRPARRRSSSAATLL
jgi:hypothetical protein